MVIANPLAVTTTQNGGLPGAFNVAGFSRDSNGIYHAKRDALQQYGGYNDFYDSVFNAATHMDADKFPFSTRDGKDYVIWVWKGDYLNLGAGAELGIYEQSVIPGHWNANPRDLSLPMSMTLDRNGTQIASYYPSEPQWWVTSFNPYVQGVKPDELNASFTVDFSGRSEMYESFSDRYAGRPGWEFNAPQATFRF